MYVDRMSPLWVEGQVVEYKVRPGAKMHFLTLRDLQTDTSMTVTASSLRATSASFLPMMP